MIGSVGQQDLQSSFASGPAPRVTPPTAGEAYAAAREEADRLDSSDAEYRNQRDFVQQRIDAFTAKTGVPIAPFQVGDGPQSLTMFKDGYRRWLQGIRDQMQDAADDRGDPSLMMLGSDEDIARGGLSLARGAQQRSGELQRTPSLGGSLGRIGAGQVDMATDPYMAAGVVLSLPFGGEGGLLVAALRGAGAMGGQQLLADAGRYGYRQQVDPSYGIGDVAKDVAGAAVAGGLFGAGHALGGEGLKATLGAAAGGAVGGGALGALSGGGPGAFEGAVGGAALPLLGASPRAIGMSWRALKARSPEVAADMPLEVRDAGEVAEKRGDLEAQKPHWPGPSGDAAHGEAIGAAEDALVSGKRFNLPQSAASEAAARRGQVFFPGGSIEARYALAEHADLITSHDADFNVRPDYPVELQPRDRSSAPAQDQVNQIAANLEPDRLGPSPEANAGAPIAGPDGVVESGNGRTIAIGRAYDEGRGEAYRAWLEKQGFDTTGYERPVLVGVRETPMGTEQRAGFAHAANGSASLRMSATEQALSDARHLDSSIVDLAKSADLAAAANRDFARAFVAKLPQGERGGMLTRDGGLSANGVRRAQAAMAARAYGDQAVLARAFDHPDPNIKAIGGALTDAAGPWARMRDAATRGDIEAGHDITRDMLQAVHAIMRARDEARPAWEMLNQGDIFQSDTTQLAARMFFRDEAMRQPAGRARVAEALASYAEEAVKNTTAGRLFDDAVAPGDVLKRLVDAVFPRDASDEMVLASLRKVGEGDSLDDLAEQMRRVLADDTPSAPRSFEQALEDIREKMRDLLGTQAREANQPSGVKAGEVRFVDELPAGAEAEEYQQDFQDGTLTYDLAFVREGDAIHAVVSNIGRWVDEDAGTFEHVDLSRVQAHQLRRTVEGYLSDHVEGARWDDLTEEQRAAETAAAARDEAARDAQKTDEIGAAVDAALADGWRPEPTRAQSYDYFSAPASIQKFASPRSMEKVAARLRERGYLSGDETFASLRRSPEKLAADLDTAAQDAVSHGEEIAARARESSTPPRERGEDAALPQQDLTLRNAKTGRETQAQSVAPLKDALKAFDIARDTSADPLARATAMAIGDRLGRLIGETKVFTVGPAEMRALAEGRIKMQAGFEPAGYFDARSGHIVVLDDAMRRPAEASRLLIHEGLHAAFMSTIDASDSARNVIDHLRLTASAINFERGGAQADHYGLTNAHEFVSEAFSNPEFQRFLASIPADERAIAAFGLDKAPGYTLWDVFVAAVRKILGVAPDQHSLLDATLRLGDILEKRREELQRGGGTDLAPMLRPTEPDVPRTPEEEAARGRAFANVKDAISYRINSDRIAQHPDGPRAGFLSILTNDPGERKGHDRRNVEALGAYYQDKIAAIVGEMTEAYGSKWAGLKQDVAGFRDVISELFGVDTKNATAKAVADAMRKADEWATSEAKRLGKVFTPAEDWRVVQWWESSRALKFGKGVLLADVESEIAEGGLKVFDPDTHEEANPLRMRAILDGAVEKIATDASLGGGHASGGGAFKTDMRVFRFAEGEAGRDAYLRLMDKYGVGSGNYLSAMQTHYARIGRELGMMEVLGPGWREVGERLREDSLLAARTIRSNERMRTTAERLRDLPKDTGRFLFSWLDSENRVNATWQHMSGQASGVGSELMASIMAGARSYEVATKMGSAILTAVPGDTVNAMMAAKFVGMDMGRLAQKTFEAFLKDSPHLREEAERLGIAAHAGIDAAVGTKRFADQVLGEKVMSRMADFVIRAQGLHAWDNALRRVFVQEFFGTIGQRAGVAFADLDKPFARFLDGYGFGEADWAEMSRPEHMLPTDNAKYLLVDNLPQPLRIRLASAVYDQRQFAYLAGGSERVRSMSAGAKAGTFAGELGKSALMFKSFAMTMMATWGKRAMNEAGQGRYGTAATLAIGMTMAGALAVQARSIVQGKDPRNMKDPWFWAEAGLQGGALGYWGDFFHSAFSRSDTSLTESLMGPLATIPASFQSLTSGARRAAEDGEHVNFGSKLARIISDAPPGGNLFYARLVKQRLVMDQLQRLIDRDYAKSFARQRQRSMKTTHQGFWWAPGQSSPARAPNLGTMLQ